MTTLVCYFLMMTASYYIGQKYYPVPYAIGNAATYIGLATLLIGLTWFTKIENFWLNQLLRFALLAGFVAGVGLREYKIWKKTA
jgi:hypothetical protein